MKRFALILVALFAVSFFAASPALADHFNYGNCNRGFGAYGRSTYYPGGYGYHAVPGRVIMGYRSVGGVGVYSPHGTFVDPNFGFGPYANPYGAYGYRTGPSFGFYFAR